MSDIPRVCAISTCEEPTLFASTTPTTEWLARNGWAYKLCREHAALAHPQTALPAPRRAAIHPAYAMFSHKEMTCYGDAGRCPNQGALYPGGPYCPEHKPR